MDDEIYLAHYGVLGMKWGVRHDPRSAFTKASNKADKLLIKVMKANERATHAQNKARKTRYGITDTGRTIWERRQIKAGKANRKADKATRKAEKWIRQMNHEFSKITLTEAEEITMNKYNKFLTYRYIEPDMASDNQKNQNKKSK